MESKTFLVTFMKWEKIAIVVVLCYLLIAIPLYFFNQQTVKECEFACAKEKYDLVISASIIEQNIECKCFDSFTRKEKDIVISQKG